MSLTVTNVELELLDERDYTLPPCLTFESSTFCFTPEQGSLDWYKLANAIKRNIPCTLDWSPSNGSCSINVQDGYVTFTVAKYGDGRGGHLSMKLPYDACIDAFQTANHITTAWLSNQHL